MTEVLESASTKHVSVAQRHLLKVFNEYGFALPVNVNDFQRGRDLAAELIGSDIAATSVFQDIQEHSGAGMLLFREKGEITGVAGLLMLTDAGRKAILSNSFNSKKPDLKHIAQRGKPQVAAIYAWLAAATTHDSRVAVVTISMGLMKQIFTGLPCFANAVTPEGAAAVQTYLHMEPLASRPGLYWNPGISAPEQDTAPAKKRTRRA